MGEDTIEDRLHRLRRQLDKMEPTPVNLNEGLQALTKIVIEAVANINQLNAVAKSSSAVFDNLIKTVELLRTQQRELIGDQRQRRES